MKWKKYKCLDRIFDVSDTGKVLNEQGKVLKGSVQPGGFRTINFKFTHNNERFNKTLIVHRMVATCFIENLEVKPYVIHLNGDHKDNRAKNLAWATSDEKILHQRRNGKPHPDQKLTQIDVVRIRKLIAEKQMTIEAIGQKFGVSHTQIHRIKRGENWSDVVAII